MLTQPNHTQLPNEFIEKYMCQLRGSSVKVFMVICRQTIGWHRQRAAVAYSQIKKWTGLENTAIKEALVELIEHDLITCFRRPGQTTLYDINYSKEEATPSESEEAISPETREDLSGNQRGTSPESGDIKERRKESSKETPILPGDSLYHGIWDGFLSHQPTNGNGKPAFKNYGKEGAATKQLCEECIGRLPDDPEKFAKELMVTF